MGLRINTNVEAFNAHRSLLNTSMKLSKSMERLSSGFRINRAGDDAAGLGISERMRAQINGTAQAIRNAQDGISLVQTAEGSMQEFHSILHRIRDLAVQYNNGIYDQASKDAIVAEVSQLSAEIDRMIGSAVFNNIPLLSNAGVLATLQIGPNNGDVVEVPAVSVAADLGNSVVNFVNVNTATSQTININALDTAMNAVSDVRGQMGSVQNRLEHTVNFLSVYQENMMAAESRIRDVDMAAEMTNFTKLQILQQSGTAMLAQANLASQGVLGLMA